jgi:hypothetical protein
MGKHLALLMNVVSGFKSFSEAPRLAGSVVPTSETKSGEHGLKENSRTVEIDPLTSFKVWLSPNP